MSTDIDILSESHTRAVLCLDAEQFAERGCRAVTELEDRCEATVHYLG